ncbi:hypothetical protein [Winogradskyella sp. UBA3174]|uniref:hypothetical protein n=1 Tax=Winogradskyella sp. UBA3174 TaxID=1947785 RepID=UPI0025EE72B1|nr:hypothetical protein [Winogradskyella sp. UBA3174]|tara:strand:- start:2588 stop:2938 length:351 start_codon:yes stop_codon:yes gene_type:complete
MKIIITIFALAFINLSSAQVISDDDKLHFAAGALISGTTYAIVYSKTKNKKKAFWYSLGASALVGLAKEVYDGYIISGRFDTGELAATTTGGLFVSTSFSIFTGKRKKKQKIAFNY